MTSKPVTTDPNTLATIVTGLGGTVIPGEAFRFDLPLESVKEVVPKLNELGLGVFKVSERMQDHPTRLNNLQTVATLGLYKPDKKLDHLPEW
jgi:hypothetical protein